MIGKVRSVGEKLGRSGGAYGRALRLLPTLPNYKAPRKIFKNLPSACKFSRLRLGNHMNLFNTSVDSVVRFPS